MFCSGRNYRFQDTLTGDSESGGELRASTHQATTDRLKSFVCRIPYYLLRQRIEPIKLEDCMDTIQEETAACGCFGRCRRPSPVSSYARRSTNYHDCGEFVSAVADDSQFFMDALEEEEDDDEYPVITTTYVSKPPRRLSIDCPESMLRQQDGGNSSIVLTGQDTTSTQPRRKSLFSRRGTMAARKSLVRARSMVVERGFPGQLSNQELDECIKFYRRVKQNPTVCEIVFSFAPIEDEPYALCRFMRSTKFNSLSMLERLENGAEMWNEAKENGFYPNVEDAIGTKLSLFLKMYPTFYHGNAKNGCPVSYFQAGKMNTEGLLCLVTIDAAARFYWNQYLHVFKQHLERARERNPDFCRCEAVNVMDFTGLSSSQFNADTTQTLQVLTKVNEFFPETLHCLIIINAPSWFNMAWKVIRRFLDARTAKKIEIYSDLSTGQARLLELVEKDQVPVSFGGTANSTVLSKDDNLILRVVQVKKRKPFKLSNMFELRDAETASIHVHTRSSSGALVSVWRGADSKHPTQQVKISRSDGTDTSSPYSTEIGSLAGPAMISIQLEHIDDYQGSKKLPNGHFLVVVEKKTTN